MDAELRQIVEMQCQQNQLLIKQLRWLKFGLLTLAVLVAASTACLGYLIRERGAHESYTGQLAAEPLLEPMGSLANNDVVPWGVRIEVSEMAKPESITPIDYRFPTSATDDEPWRRGCSGMCL